MAYRKFASLPGIIRISTVFACMFYVVFLIELVSVTLIPTSKYALWLSLMNSVDTVYVLDVVRARNIEVSEKWTRLVDVMHAKNPEVLKALYRYMKHNISLKKEEELLYRIAVGNPINTENKDALFMYYFDHDKYQELYRDLKKWGADAMDEKWTQRFYVVGLKYVKKGNTKKALLYWQWAAWLSPSWSHMWIEYATLLQSLGRHEEAVRALKKCSKDIYAGAHCLDLLEDFKMNDPPPLGFYNAIIRGDLHDE